MLGGIPMIYFFIALFSSIIGAICGIGGGVIIKPVLDFFQVGTVATISFLSSCTVLSMSLYSVSTSLMDKQKNIDLRTATPLAIGAVIGGLLGKSGFQLLSQAVSNNQLVGATQSLCLSIITLATLIYTINKDKIHTLTIQNPITSILIGLILGVFSSFLGIGGGPINLVVLFYFFSMDTKKAAACSLYIILFSQISSFLFSLATSSIPNFEPFSLFIMILGGIAGGIIGRFINKRISTHVVDKLFQILILIIIGISTYNFISFI